MEIEKLPVLWEMFPGRSSPVSFFPYTWGPVGAGSASTPAAGETEAGSAGSPLAPVSFPDPGLCSPVPSQVREELWDLTPRQLQTSPSVQESQRSCRFTRGLTSYKLRTIFWVLAHFFQGHYGRCASSCLSLMPSWYKRMIVRTFWPWQPVGSAGWLWIFLSLTSQIFPCVNFSTLFHYHLSPFSKVFLDIFPHLLSTHPWNISSTDTLYVCLHTIHISAYA